MTGPVIESYSGAKTDLATNFDDPLYVHRSDNAFTSVICFNC